MAEKNDPIVKKLEIAIEALIFYEKEGNKHPNGFISKGNVAREALRLIRQ